MFCNFSNIELRTCKELKITQTDEKKNKGEKSTKSERRESGGKKTEIALNFRICLLSMAREEIPNARVKFH